MKNEVSQPNDGYERDGEGRILSPFNADFRAEGIARTAEEMSERIKGAELRKLDDKTYQTILEQTQAKAAIVITFPRPLLGSPFFLTDFHISAVNVQHANFPAILAVIIDALLGRLGGNMRFNGGGEPPAPTGV